MSATATSWRAFDEWSDTIFRFSGRDASEIPFEVMADWFASGMLTDEVVDLARSYGLDTAPDLCV